MRKIRGLSKKVVAIGSCACTGMPSAQRNTFPDETKEEIQDLIDRFAGAKEVQIEELRCRAKGDDICEYYASWK